MKVTIDPRMPKLTRKQREELREAEIMKVEDDPAEFKKQMTGVREVIMSPEIAQQLADMGMTPDDLVAILLKQSGTSN